MPWKPRLTRADRIPDSCEGVVMRTLFGLVTTLFVLAPVRAADPTPLWEIDTATPGRTSFQVQWVGFSPDGKQLAARFIAGSNGGRETEWLAEFASRGLGQQ